MGARETALNALIACRKEGAWSNGILKDYIRRDKLDSRDAALAARLCYGVLQNRLRLDYYLQQLLTGKLRDLHPAVRDILHLGLYQLLEMDKIPVSAAVNEAVSLAKKYCKVRSAPGLVNGVLRNASRTQFREPEGLSQRYSHPEKLVALLRSYVGEERLEKMLQANNEFAPTVAQVNTLQITCDALTQQLTREGVTVQPHPWMKDCLILTGTGDLEKLPSFRDGLFYIQDAAAKLSVQCTELTPDTKILDCCAAPGGKSFAAAVAMAGTGRIISCDVHPHKIALIQSGADRLGLTNLTARVQDASQFVPEWEGQMDVVIADVPCSGYGIIRKKPDIRYKDPDTMNDLPKLQLAILENQARYLRPGGLLMYSTCTLVRKENEGVVKAFLKAHPEFTPEPLPLPDIFPKNTTGMEVLVPGQYDTDGFFICRLRRER